MVLPETVDYNSPQALKAFLERSNMAMQKKFGQNFLVNGQIRTRLADALEIDGASSVWEIGPGLGAMTKEILARGARLTAFEIDRGFIAALRRLFPEQEASGQLKIVEGDVLKNWRRVLKADGAPQRLFGNLPYNIAAAVLCDTIEEGARFDRCVVTVQKEVAARMAAAASTESYSSFSVLCQWGYDVTPLFDLAGGNFWPRPNVESRSVLMERKAAFPRCENPVLFIKMQRALFSSRRKNIRNNLSAFLRGRADTERLLHAAGIPPTARAESLSIEEMLRLSDTVNAAIIGVWKTQ